MGVTVPQVIFNPEPSFSDEARKAKAQGIVMLLLVVGKDGRPNDVRVGQSLGMGLDEKAIEAVNHWRFRPATLNGQPVATQIAVRYFSTRTTPRVLPTANPKVCSLSRINDSANRSFTSHMSYSE